MKAAIIAAAIALLATPAFAAVPVPVAPPPAQAAPQPFPPLVQACAQAATEQFQRGIEAQAGVIGLQRQLAADAAQIAALRAQVGKKKAAP